MVPDVLQELRPVIDRWGKAPQFVEWIAHQQVPSSARGVGSSISFPVSDESSRSCRRTRLRRDQTVPMGNLQGVADLLVAQVLLRVEQDRLSVVRRDPLDQIGEPTSPLGVDHVRDDAIIEGYVGGTVLV